MTRPRKSDHRVSPTTNPLLNVGEHKPRCTQSNDQVVGDPRLMLKRDGKATGPTQPPYVVQDNSFHRDNSPLRRKEGVSNGWEPTRTIQRPHYLALRHGFVSIHPDDLVRLCLFQLVGAEDLGVQHVESVVLANEACRSVKYVTLEDTNDLSAGPIVRKQDL